MITLSRPVIHGMLKWRSNAKVHIIDAKTGRPLCGEPADEGTVYLTPKEATCDICIYRFKSSVQQ